MYFQQTREPFGDLTALSITSEEEGSTVTILPESGARVNSFLVPHDGGHLDVIEGYATPEEVLTEDYAKGSLLAPFPNRVADGAYTFEGEGYQLPINKPDEHNAIHGFLSAKPFTIAAVEENEDSVTVRMEYRSDGAEGYPFPFLTEVAYTFSGLSLRVATNITNTGTHDMPVGVGWHPYFRLNGALEELSLRLPDVEKIEVDERLIPTGQVFAYEDFKQPRPVGDTRFDTGFRFLGPDKEVAISSAKLDRTLRLSCGKNYEFLQLFTPPWRRSIAVEPMTCAADAFNNGLGLTVLSPGETLFATFLVTVE